MKLRKEMKMKKRILYYDNIRYFYVVSLAVCVAAGYFVNELLNKGSSKISAKVFQVLKME